MTFGTTLVDFVRVNYGENTTLCIYDWWNLTLSYLEVYGITGIYISNYLFPHICLIALRLTLSFCRKWPKSEEVERLSEDKETVHLEPSPNCSCNSDSSSSCWSPLHVFVLSDESAIFVETLLSLSLSRIVNLISRSLNISEADSLKGAINVSACNEVIKKQMHYSNSKFPVNYIPVLIIS